MNSFSLAKELALLVLSSGTKTQAPLQPETVGKSRLGKGGHMAASSRGADPPRLPANSSSTSTGGPHYSHSMHS